VARDTSRGRAKGTDQPRERYTHGYSDANVQTHAARTATDNAAFLLPHLKPNMNIIDCGCALGSSGV
jgi:hypothetical protein